MTNRLLRMREGGQPAESLVNACFHLLRVPEPEVPALLVHNGRTLAREDSHQQWCAAVTGQALWPNPWDGKYDANINEQVRNSWHLPEAIVGWANLT